MRRRGSIARPWPSRTDDRGSAVPSASLGRHRRSVHAGVDQFHRQPPVDDQTPRRPGQRLRDHDPVAALSGQPEEAGRGGVEADDRHAVRVEVSEPTLGRFCRALGYRSFKGLKDCLKTDLGDRPWLIADRLREFGERARADDSQAEAGLRLQIEALVSIYETARSDAWRTAVQRLATATTVHVAGFQTERGMAQQFAHQLQYLGDGVTLLDQADGNFAPLLAAPPDGRCLVMFEARRYSRWAKLLARDARDGGIPVTLVTDAYCDWGHELATETFVVHTEFNLFWESTAQMATLANLLVNGVFIELGPAVEARMETVSGLYSRYTGHVGSPPERDRTA